MLRAAGLAGLGEHVLHVPRGEELALLDVDGLAARRAQPAPGRSAGTATRGSAGRRRPRRPPALPALSCTSVSTGRPVARAPRRGSRGPLRMPMPRNDVCEVRLALSNEALKTMRHADVVADASTERVGSGASPSRATRSRRGRRSGTGVPPPTSTLRAPVADRETRVRPHQHWLRSSRAPTTRRPARSGWASRDAAACARALRE